MTPDQIALVIQAVLITANAIIIFWTIFIDYKGDKMEREARKRREREKREEEAWIEEMIRWRKKSEKAHGEKG